MYARRLLLVAAVAFWTVSWAMPVGHIPGREPAVVGWQAFRLALSPVWAFELDFRLGGTIIGDGAGSATFANPDETTVGELFDVASALTNVVFLLGAVAGIAWAFLGWLSPRGVARVGLALAACALLNVAWPWMLGNAPLEPYELRAGYFAWLGAYLVLAAALAPRRAAAPAPATGASPPAAAVPA